MSDAGADSRSDAILLEIEDGIAWVTFNEPTVRNALTPALRLRFAEIFPRLEYDDAVRCVVVRGAGDHFMAGGDIRLMQTRLEMPANERQRAITDGLHALHRSLISIRRMGKPVIASVQGAAAGFGLGLVGACDMAIAAEDAFFTLAYCHIGASPDGGTSYFVARSVGMKQQFELAFLGERFTAERARELGLVNFVVPRADLDAETRKLAQRLAAGPTRAFAHTKALFNASGYLGLEAHLQMEAERIAESMTTEDHAEGVRAFMEKRTPQFEGD